MGGENEHGRLAWTYVPYEQWGPAQRGWYATDDARRAKAISSYRRRFFGQFRAVNGAILSSEEFAWLPVDAVRRLRRDLHDVGFEEVQVVLYVGEPGESYVSWVQQLLEQSSLVLDPLTFHLPVRYIAERWEQVFPGSVVVRSFSSNSKFDVVQDFSGVTEKFLGVSVPSNPSPPTTMISAEGMEILQRYRETFRPGHDGLDTAACWRLVEFLKRSRAVVPQTDPELRPEIRARIRARHRDDFAFIAKHYGVELQMDCAEVPQPPEFTQQHLRVADVLKQVDPEIVTDLLLHIAKQGLDREPPKRTLPVRIASRLSRRYRSAHARLAGASLGHATAPDTTAVAGRVVVHIGTFKTGSTSIQEALERAGIDGDLKPVCYPLGGHRYLAWSYLPYERRRPQERFAENARRAEMLGGFRRDILKALDGNDRAILSTEDFSWLTADEIAQFRKDLGNLGFGNFRVVLYVRDPADYYLSWIQQLLKVSDRVVNPISFRCPFLSVAEAWEQVFPGCVDVRLFAEGSNFDVVQDFSSVTEDFLGVAVPSMPKRANTTVSAEGMTVLQRYREVFWSDRDGVGTPDSLRLVEFLARSKTLVPQIRPELRPEIAAWVRANHHDDLGVLAERYGVDLPARCAEVRKPTNFDREDLRVADVVQRVDGATVTALLLQIARAGLQERRPS